MRDKYHGKNKFTSFRLFKINNEVKYLFHIGFKFLQIISFEVEFILVLLLDALNVLIFFYVLIR